MSPAVETVAMTTLLGLLQVLKLPTVARHAGEVAGKAEREGWSFVDYLRHLAELEVAERRRRRIERNLRDSALPGDKTLATLDLKRLPAKAARTLGALCAGGFVERGDNVLLFGLPGRGKSHVACAIGHELVRRGHRVLFTPTYALVQRLLAAKRDLRLEKELAQLDGYDAVILDDIGYVQQSRDEMEVLFTFLAERYERRSVIITSNLVFSEWNRIFQDPMTTAAAIDRLVHHAVILEMTGSSVRADQARSARKEETPPTTTTPPTTITDDVQSGPEATKDKEAAPTTTTPTTTTTGVRADQARSTRKETPPTTTTSPATITSDVQSDPEVTNDKETAPTTTTPTTTTTGES